MRTTTRWALVYLTLFLTGIAAFLFALALVPVR